MRHHANLAYSTSAYGIAFAASLALLWAYFIPLAAAPLSSYLQLFAAQGQPGSPLSDYFFICVRTLGVALVTAVVAVLGSAVVSASLSRSNLSQRFAIFGIPLLLPYFLGNSTDGLLVKLLSQNFADRFTYFADRSYGLVYVFLFALLIWKDGFLILYTLTLIADTVPKSVTLYARALGLTLREWIRDVLWPMARPAGILLCLFVFIAAEHEYIATFLSLRPSPGTGTELVSHWMNRVYTTLVLSTNASTALDLLSASGIVLLVASLAAGAISVGLLLGIIRLGTITWRSRIRARATRSATGMPMGASVTGILAVIFAVSPVVLAASFLTPSFPNDMTLATFTAPLTFVVALGGTILGWMIAVAARLMLGDRTINAAVVVRVLLMLLSAVVVPPFLVGLSSFSWWSMTSGSSQFGLIALWAISQLALVTPLIASFLFASFLSVTNSELRYQRWIGASLGEIASNSFAKRYVPQLLFSLLFAFLQVWNEDSVNGVFENVVPSFSTLINRTLSGRAESIANASGYAYFGIALAIVLGIFWLIALLSSRRGAADA